MSWPTDDIETSSLDSGSDKPNRSHFLTLFTRVKELIAARGAQNGVASLGADSKVPAAQLPRGEADGVASLDSDSKVPAAQLPAATRSTVYDYGIINVNGVLTSIETLKTIEGNTNNPVTDVNLYLDIHETGRLRFRLRVDHEA